MPRYAISDIHGCKKTFVSLLETIGLTKHDELFLLGDYIDRGPDSYGVIEHIWKLVEEGYRVTCLRGNHEAMLIDALKGRGRAWDYYPDITNAHKIRDWMDRLPYYAETPGYLLVHAGLNFTGDDPLSDTEAMLWSRNWEATIDTDWLGDRVIVHGHTPAAATTVRENAALMHATHFACIDSGCVLAGRGMGYLTALNLDSGEVTFEAFRDQLGST